MSPRRLPLTALRTLEAAIHLSSFKLAAEELCVTPTTVSNQIRQLETDLGYLLFVRKTRQVIPTEEGKALGHSVSGAFDSIRGTLASNEKNRNRRRRVVLCAGSFFASRWLSTRLIRFREAHPDIDLQVRSAATVGDLDSLGADMAVDWGSGTWLGLTAENLMNITYTPVASPELIARHGPYNAVRDLSRFPALHQRDKSEWQEWLKIAGEPGLMFSDDIIIDDYNVVMQAALESQGVALTILQYIEPEIQSGRLICLSNTTLQPDRSYFLLTRRTPNLSPEAAIVRTWLKSEADVFSRTELVEREN